MFDNRSNEVLTGRAVLVIAGIEPEVEDEVADVEAMDEDQSSDTMKGYENELEIKWERERERELTKLNLLFIDIKEWCTNTETYTLYILYEQLVTVLTQV